MISLESIKAIILRYFYVWRSDYNTMLCGLYWPLLDVIIWGFLGSWMQQVGDISFQNYQFVALLSILLWQLVGRGSNIILNTVIEELWANNLINLFSLPVRLSEYIIAVIVFYISMILGINIFCTAAISLFYGISFFFIIKNFLLFFLPYMLCGIWLGFTGLAVMIILGKRGAEISYIITWFLLPFSGVSYPISVLPSWGQTLSMCFPMSYLSQAVRHYFLYNSLLIDNIIFGTVLAIIYLVMGISLFVYCFNRSKIKGFTKLTE